MRYGKMGHGQAGFDRHGQYAFKVHIEAFER
jgi:hypothetical protein